MTTYVNTLAHWRQYDASSAEVKALLTSIAAHLDNEEEQAATHGLTTEHLTRITALEKLLRQIHSLLPFTPASSPERERPL